MHDSQLLNHSWEFCLNHPQFFNIPCNILVTVSSAQITKVIQLILLKVPKTYVTYFWHQCSVSDKLGPQHISESLTQKIESISGLYSHTFDFTFVSYPAIKHPDCSVSLICPIHGLSLPQNVKSQNFIGKSTSSSMLFLESSNS